MTVAGLPAPRSFQIVVAATRQKLGIGLNGGLPWRLPSELALFKELTARTRDPERQNAVIMGRKTWESIPERWRPLKNRLNIVLSRSCVDSGSTVPGGVHMTSSLKDALAYLSSDALQDVVENIFVIGGGQVYRDAIASPHCAAVHITKVGTDAACDTFFPDIDPAAFALWSTSAARVDDGIRYEVCCYVNKALGEAVPRVLPPGMASRHEEYQYLDLIQDVMDTGYCKRDRTGTGTFSKFGCQMRFNLRYSFPLLTTKRVFWRGVAEELLWFLRGCTNVRPLQEKGINIWNGNSSREYLDSIGLSHREEGDLGPVYGFQWRHFGAEYTTMHADYSGKGVDQLQDIIHKLKTNPDDRRIILSAWNPAALKEMALPPCHMFCQFYVAEGELSCQMYQRSADLGLGVPFNIASYALLTYILAHECGLRPGELVHTMGDTHVYTNHVEPLRMQLQNEPRPFPTLTIKAEKGDVTSLTMDNFVLEGYNPHPKIPMKMAV